MKKYVGTSINYYIVMGYYESVIIMNPDSHMYDQLNEQVIKHFIKLGYFILEHVLYFDKKNAR